MTFPTPLAATQRISRCRFTAQTFVLLFAAMCALATMAAAQTSINPATSTIQFAGSPNTDGAVSSFTAPAGGIVLNGTRISAITGRPARYLWVGDGNFGLCRVDPEIDAPGIHDINDGTCPFKLNGQSITGGPLVLDPVTNFLYLTDIRQGIYRMHYLPDGDSGNGFLDFSSIFPMAGVPSGARFRGGQTGCPWPTNSTLATNPAPGKPSSLALGPDNNIYVGFSKNGAIMRINQPASATTTGFGSCADFVQLVAITPDNGKTVGLAFVGHDLWGADGTGPFVIPNADTACQALGPNPTTTPTCVATNTLAAVAAPNSVNSDQFFPQLNGNNLYFGLGAPGNVVWVGNVAAGAAGQTIDLTLIDTTQLPPPPQFPPLGNIGVVTVDYTDPANFTLLTGEDIGGAGALGQGRWWETCQGQPQAAGLFNCPTPSATSAPGTPMVVRAVAGNGQATVSWSAAQSVQPVTSYTVHITAADAHTVPDVVVTGSPFPSTSTTIALANGTSYTFQVQASNGQGSSASSSASNSVSLPGFNTPTIPVLVSAQAGDTAAFVSWTDPASNGGSPITSYTVTAIANNARTGITSTVLGATATSAIVTGLNNGTSYTFAVHATNVAGSGLDSTPSNAVVPSTSQVLAVAESGPPSISVAPVQVTYNISITNNSILPVTNAVATDTLTTTDGAFILIGQPSQGSCSAAGSGVTTISCNLGTINAGVTVKLNVIVQIQQAAVTNSVSVTALDNAAVTQTGSASFSTAPPPPPTQTVSATISVTGNAQVPNPNLGQAGNIVWTISNTTQNAAQNILFKNTIPAGLQLNSIAVTVNNNGTFNCTFTPTGGLSAPCPGTFNTTAGGLIEVTTPSLGGSTKNGAKPPQTMIVTTNVTPPATTAHGTVFQSTGTMTFGPGGTDTLPSTATVTITVR